MNAKIAFALAALALGGISSAEEKTSGILPGLLVGPRLSLLALPTPGAGLEVRGPGPFGASLDLGYIPMVSVGGHGNAKIGFTNVSGAGRIYPFSRSFFLGAAVGSRSFRAKARDDATGAEARASVASVYLAPELGWRWIWGSGFFMGVDLGWQFVLSHKATFDFPATAKPKDVTDVQHAADRVGKAGLPVLGLLQLGWFF